MHEHNRTKHPELYPLAPDKEVSIANIIKHCDLVSEMRRANKAKKLVKVCLKDPPF